MLDELSLLRREQGSVVPHAEKRTLQDFLGSLSGQIFLYCPMPLETLLGFAFLDSGSRVSTTGLINFVSA
jgi:hypothetical protein